MATRKSFDKERWEAMTGMEMSQLLPECETLKVQERLLTMPGMKSCQQSRNNPGSRSRQRKTVSLLHPSAGLAAGNAGCHWKSTAAHSCKFPE